jgi:type 1 glutamine amidotransferase
MRIGLTKPWSSAMSPRRIVPFLALLLLAVPLLGADVPKLAVEVPPTDSKSTKIVLVAGSNFYKKGEHDYIPNCAALADLLRQSNVAPVLALDWPKKPETFAGAKAVVFFYDGGDKNGVLKDDRAAQVQKLADAGVGIVHLHQAIDYPRELGDRVRGWAGGAWEKGYGQRAHWTAEFKTFPDHAIFCGVKPFTVNDGWIFKIRFVDNKKGITPLLRTTAPKSKIAADSDDAIVAWTYERPGGGRSFTFTGGHLHESFGQEGYRRFLVNGILWSAGVDVPTAGAPVALTPEALEGYYRLRPMPTKK